jgi:hypothetical protein
MSPVKRQALISSLPVAVAVVTLSGCSPLPGATFDPVYAKVGATPAPSPSQAVMGSSQAAPLMESKLTDTSVWVGPYRDSRGSGELALSVVRKEAALAGTWKLRTGGGGPFNATVGADGRRMTFRMENTAPECPGKFEGWTELGEAAPITGRSARGWYQTVSDFRGVGVSLIIDKKGGEPSGRDDPGGTPGDIFGRIEISPRRGFSQTRG